MVVLFTLPNYSEMFFFNFIFFCFNKSFYERSPAGLSGAMEDLGILFAGRQHSGYKLLCELYGGMHIQLVVYLRS